MRTYSAIIERDPHTGLLVGYVPGFPGAHSQGATPDELAASLKEVIEMLLEDNRFQSSDVPPADPSPPVENLRKPSIQTV